MGNLRAKVCAAGPQQGEEMDRPPRALTQTLYQDQDALQPHNAPSLPQHPMLPPPTSRPHPGQRHPEQTPCPGSPELCRETPVTLAGMTLALVSFSRPEHTSLLPPSTAQVLPWAPTSDMAPAERKRMVAQQPVRRGNARKESQTGRRWGSQSHLRRRAPAPTARSWSAGRLRRHHPRSAV